MSLYYYHSGRCLHNLIHHPDIATMIQMYVLLDPGLMMHDRSGLNQLPINTTLYPGSEIPAFQKTILTYGECCDLRSRELWDLSSNTGLPLYVTWSGGIDSTMVMTSFLRTFPISELRDRIKIVMNEDSIIENPHFYRLHILPNFELVNSQMTPWLFSEDNILVTGECNDQLFGSDMLEKYLYYSQEDFLAPYNPKTILKYLNHRIGHLEAAMRLTHMVSSAAGQVGVVLEKNCDWFWWFNFCFKWQNVQFRFFTTVAPTQHNTISAIAANNIKHFFSTKELQLWSMNNQSTREIRQWNDYKKVIKTEIFEYDRNEEYFEFKLKRPSLGSVFRHRKLIPAIDSGFNLLDSTDISRFYNPDNIFNMKR